MRIALTHENADFDALASLVAATLLFPGTTPVLGTRVIEPVRDFMALHRDRFDIKHHPEIDEDRVTGLVVVDTRNATRLPPLERTLARARAGEIDLHIFDHHRASPDDLTSPHEVVEPVGACATLFVEAFERQHLTVDPVEATLLLIAIFADTGNLCFPNTTARDFEAAGWLRERGARLSVVNRFLRTIFSEEQRQTIARVQSALRVEEVGGVRLGIANVELGKVVSGLAAVTRHVLHFEGLDALFAVYGMGRKGVQIVGRADVPHVDVGHLLGELGGGGHRGAAAARLKKTTPQEAEAQLRHLLDLHPPRPRRVSDVMSSPVRTIDPDLPLHTLQRSLAAWRHTGVPVVRDNLLVGIISRRDVEAAAQADRLHLAVSSCMAHVVQSVDADDPLEDALQRMIDANIGRLPVLRDGRLIGIVTRTDLLRVLYEGAESSAPLDP